MTAAIGTGSGGVIASTSATNTPQESDPFVVITNDRSEIIQIVREYLSSLNDLYLEFRFRELHYTPETSLFLKSCPEEINWEVAPDHLPKVSPHHTVLKYPFLVTLTEPEKGRGMVYRCDTQAKTTFHVSKPLNPSQMYANRDWLILTSVSSNRLDDGVYAYSFEREFAIHLPAQGFSQSRFLGNGDQLATLSFRKPKEALLDVWDLSTGEQIRCHSLAPWVIKGFTYDLELAFERAYFRFDDVVVPSLTGKNEYVYSVSSNTARIAPSLIAPSLPRMSGEALFTIHEEPGAWIVGFRSIVRPHSTTLGFMMRFGNWEKWLAHPITLSMEYVPALDNGREKYGFSYYTGLSRHHLMVATHEGLAMINLIHPFDTHGKSSFAFMGNFISLTKPLFPTDPPRFTFQVDGDRIIMLPNEEDGRPKLLKPN